MEQEKRERLHAQVTGYSSVRFLGCERSIVAEFTGDALVAILGALSKYRASMADPEGDCEEDWDAASTLIACCEGLRPAAGPGMGEPDPCQSDWTASHKGCDNPAEMTLGGVPCCAECYHDADEVSHPDPDDWN